MTLLVLAYCSLIYGLVVFSHKSVLRGLQYGGGASYPVGMEEMLDVVNEQDEVIGQATRSRVHSDNLRHRATHILLFNSAEQVFMQLRSKIKDTNPGLWDTSAAGHVDAGETYLNCAVRELHEELGVAVSANDLHEIGRIPPSSENGFEFVRVYRAVSDAPITLCLDEVEDGKWVSESALDAWLKSDQSAFAMTFSSIWQLYREHQH